jgi:hypothetical protein
MKLKHPGVAHALLSMAFTYQRATSLDLAAATTLAVAGGQLAI